MNDARAFLCFIEPTTGARSSRQTLIAIALARPHSQPVLIDTSTSPNMLHYPLHRLDFFGDSQSSTTPSLIMVLFHSDCCDQQAAALRIRVDARAQTPLIHERLESAYGIRATWVTCRRTKKEKTPAARLFSISRRISLHAQR